MKTRTIVHFAVLVLLGLVTNVFALDKTIADISASDPQFSIAASLIDSAGLKDFFSKTEPITVFVPTDEAFSKLPPFVLDYLESYPDVTTRLLTYHVIQGEQTSSDLITAKIPTMEITSNGESIADDLNIRVGANGITVNNATVTAFDILASNGVVHAIDTVLVPSLTLPDIGMSEINGPVSIVGSSTVFPLTDAVAKSFTRLGYTGEVTVTSTGTSGGMEHFCQKADADITMASRSITVDEAANCAALTPLRDPFSFRVGTEAIVVVVSGENDFVQELTYDQLRLVFSDPRDDRGEVIRQRTWKDIDPTWPDEPIQRFIPDVETHTFAFFNDVIFASNFADQMDSGAPADPFVASDFENSDVSSAEKAPLLSATHQTGQDNDAIADGVRNGKTAVGFFSYAAYSVYAGELRTVALAPRSNRPPMEANDDSVESNDYPFSRPLFLYSDATLMVQKPQVAAFLNYFLTEATPEITELDYVPDSTTTLNLARLYWLAATRSPAPEVNTTAAPPTAVATVIPSETLVPAVTALASETPTAPITLESIRFATIGDYGSNNPGEGLVADLVKSWNPDIIITLGDNNYASGKPNYLDRNVGQYYHEFIYPYKGSYGPGATYNRFFPIFGDHDRDGASYQEYLDYFTLPGNERYYDFVWGPVHFFALSTDPREPDGNTATSIQARWLERTMRASTSSWQLVYLHHPPYSSGQHGSTLTSRWPFQEWGADAVFSGNDHLYERIVIDGLPYFINGLGGTSIYQFRADHLVSGSEVRYDGNYGAQLVTADRCTITFEFYSVADPATPIDTYMLDQCKE